MLYCHKNEWQHEYSQYNSMTYVERANNEDKYLCLKKIGLMIKLTFRLTKTIWLQSLEVQPFILSQNLEEFYKPKLSWSCSYGSWIYNYIVSMQSVPITTNIVTSNPTQERCTWYNIMW